MLIKIANFRHKFDKLKFFAIGKIVKKEIPT